MNTVERLLKLYFVSHFDGMKSDGTPFYNYSRDGKPVYLVHKASGKYNLCLPPLEDDYSGKIRIIKHNGNEYRFSTDIHRSFDTMEEMAAYVESAMPTDREMDVENLFNYAYKKPNVKYINQFFEAFGLNISLSKLNKRRGWDNYGAEYMFCDNLYSMSQFIQRDVFDCKDLALAILCNLVVDSHIIENKIPCPTDESKRLQSLVAQFLYSRRIMQKAIELRDIFLHRKAKNYISWVKQFFSNGFNLENIKIEPCVDKIDKIVIKISTSPTWQITVEKDADDFSILKDSLESLARRRYRIDKSDDYVNFMKNIEESYRVFCESKSTELTNWLAQMKGRIAS